jgi:4-hydroxy-tetrahydrodipicolinate synthase
MYCYGQDTTVNEGNPMFEGAITALITPFDANGAVDFSALERVINFQLEGGIQGVVPCGSTGEAITMSLQERCAVIERTVKHVNKRVPVIAGTGGSSTAEVVDATLRARELGADGALINTPAYNKPQQEGLYQHYAAVATAAPDFPIMLYNIPGRTAVWMSTETCERLCNDFPKSFVAYKDATADLKQTEELLRRTSLNMLSGDDGLALPMIALGAVGVVSVAGNIVPSAVRELSDHARAGRMEEAQALNHRLAPVFDVCFVESNPVPVKAAAEMLGLCEPHVRLPLVGISDASRSKVREVLTAFGALK